MRSCAIPRALRPSFLLLTLTMLAPSAAAGGDLATASDGRFLALDVLLQHAVAHGEVPGAVVVVGHKGSVVYQKAFGFRSLEPSREPMTVDTIFDLASLTKPLATAASVMVLV
ncbi:MAG: serine hydrolase, partial [Terriglobales bacterium]